MANFGSNTVRVIRTSNGTTLRTIAHPDYLGGMELSADGARLYLATGNWSVSFGPGPLFSQASSGQFTVVNTHTWALEAQASTGFAPGMLELDSLANTAVFPSTFIDGYAHVVLPPRRGPRAF